VKNIENLLRIKVLLHYLCLIHLQLISRSENFRVRVLASLVRAHILGIGNRHVQQKVLLHERQWTIVDLEMKPATHHARISNLFVGNAAMIVMLFSDNLTVCQR
jgi:hypothetical protein